MYCNWLRVSATQLMNLLVHNHIVIGLVYCNFWGLNQTHVTEGRNINIGYFALVESTKRTHNGLEESELFHFLENYYRLRTKLGYRETKLTSIPQKDGIATRVLGF